jgi:hypothetical protein
MTKQTDERIAKLERELAALKKANAPPAYDAEAEARSTAEWRDQMHQAAERRANSFQFRPEILREMQKACGDADLADLVHASHAPQGPSGQGVVPSTQMLTGVRPGGGSGWAREVPLGPQPGIRYVDAQIDAQDRRDKAERIARQKLMEG